ncbi:helix-turn-helix domain-containing protein [Variovorax boronicumulans]|uniref:helix-turn-helix domain-containing protein n=1 Tax=Variovorax boronicumulans TaxID=436515 RepID=UPI0027800EBE|nr:helix-turn-helix transcriptional regulator [Variovorax boronicumulans]MDQ0040847.1 transcriptional regulator with XRE-family HTH domain [Variovorax boronicumulans]
MNTIAERVKAVRQELGWSQVQLAEEVGVSQSSIGNIESGVRQRPRELVSLAKALRVSPEWLETGKGPRTERAALSLVGANAEPSVRALVEYLAEIAAKQRPTLRKNLGNLLVDLVDHPEDTALIEQTIADIERFFTPPAA